MFPPQYQQCSTSFKYGVNEAINEKLAHFSPLYFSVSPQEEFFFQFFLG